MPTTAIAMGALLVLSSATPRERIRFDADWRFMRMPTVEGPARLGPFRWEWKLASVDDLYLPTLPADLGPGEWTPTRLGINVLKPRQNGWFRTELGDDPDGADKRLVFDSTDEDAAVFLNGRRIGTHIGFNTRFEFPVAAAWRAGGPNTLVVLIRNVAQTGGINGGVNLVVPASKIVPPEVAPDFDDAGWRTVHLPHDYVVEGAPDPSEDNSHGSLPKPVGIYRKSFVPPDSMRGKSVWIDFDGVYRNADVFLNGRRIGGHASGYAGFRLDLTQALVFGRPNVLAVRVDPETNEGWWYEGGGIYRHVWLNAADPLHVAPDGIFGRSEIEGDRAKVRISVALNNDAGSPQTATVVSRLFDPAGRLVGTLESKAVAVGRDGAEVEGVLTVEHPRLWDLDRPNLYRIEATVLRDGKPVDSETARFGIRSIRWDKESGFFLNGRSVKLKGTSNHQDHAGVGVAAPDRLFEWRIRTLKSMGANAYRTAHNPVARELLDACDRLGMLVLDETRHFGDTTAPKTAPGTPADDLSDLKYQVLHDRNHPCVVAWSLYNEEPLQGTAEGAAIFRKMRETVDRLDGTRLCTGATNSGFDAGIIDATVLFGINYNPSQYDAIRARRPDLILFGSETASAVSTRGVYENDPIKGYVSAYDVNRASFGNTAEEAWRAVAERPWMAGAFVWTGFDYKGEPTPYGWPCVSSHFGILDTCGFPKDTFWYYKAWWGDAPVVHILPHWNWPADKGTVKVWVHSNADSVELFLNGRSLGVKPVPRLGHAEWDVPYAPGTLEAKGTKDGKLVASDRVETTGPPARLRLKTERKTILADGEDVALVQVEVVDAKGRVVPTAANDVRFEVEGAAELGGVGNGDPSDHDPDKANRRRAFNGRCMVLVRSNGAPGSATLRATSPGLRSASLKFSAEGS